jgi:biopolymer transport protein ExbD
MRARTSASWMRPGGALVLGVAMAAVSCDDKPAAPAKPAPTQPSASASAAMAPAKPPEPASMPEVTLDASHVQVGMDDLALTVPQFQKVFKDLLVKYPVSKPATVVLNAARQVKVPEATTVVYALVDAGAKTIEVRTKPRGTFPGKLVLTPDKTIGKQAPPCTYAAMILKDFGATFWPIKGGTAKRYTKGMAGPDLTVMHEVFAKDVEKCTSTVFYFTADESLEWGHAFDLGTSVSGHDPAYKITTFVLLREAPTAGHPVKVAP